MQKFLIIAKFLFVQDFSRFYRQFATGQIFFPSSRPLPDHSNIMLKLIIPLLDDSVLASGVVIPKDTDRQTVSGMAVDFTEGLKSKIAEINHLLSGIEQYRNLLDLAVVEPDEETTTPAQLSGIEIPLVQENIFPEEKFIPDPKTDSFRLQEDEDEELMNLTMENEADDIASRIDVSRLPDFDLLDDEETDVLEFEKDADDSSKAVFTEDLSEDTPEFKLLFDDKSVSTGFSMDPNTLESTAISSGIHEVGGVLFEDLKSMVDQEEVEFEVKEEPVISARKIPEKKDLTTEERTMAEPVGQFFMNLTKAMLRSGYYAPGHPGADSAKAGLYEEFLGVLKGQREIMITNHDTRDGVDLMITGILDEPISIRVLVGPGMAELFVPKLSEYCKRKQLVSFALKSDIRPGHFYQFIDIMSDPKVDDHKDDQAGKFLTNAFIEHGITDISTVFVDDMVKLETDLPWRVEMAIHRLAKDLKVMPLFKGVSAKEIKQRKLQTIQDIIRPLKHPAYLNDFLVNCYLIAEYVTSMPAEEIEEMVVDAFSIDLLLPTSRFTFKELESLEKLKLKHPDSEIIDRRFDGIKRILKLISRRVVAGKAAGARNFLESLYRNQILAFNELPADVQFMVNSIKMADDIRNDFGKYANIIASIQKPGDALVYLKCFRRTAPILVESGDWTILAQIANSVKRVSSREPFNSKNLYSGIQVKTSDETEDYSKSELFRLLDISERALGFIFSDVIDKIINAYENADPGQQRGIEQIINSLGTLGVDIISKMLIDSNDREIRKLSYEMMINKGEQARKWAAGMLEDAGRPWFIHRNAMMILAKVSDKEADFANIRKFIGHSNPKIREELLNAVIALKPPDGEFIVAESINDDDPKVRWRALRALQHFSPVSEETMQKLLNIITLPLPKNHDKAENHINKTVHIISAINAMPSVSISRKMETEILELLDSFSGGKKSIWNKVKRVVGNDYETPVLKVAIPLLGKIGGSRSGAYLKKINRSHPGFSDIIKKALLRMNT